MKEDRMKKQLLRFTLCSAAALATLTQAAPASATLMKAESLQGLQNRATHIVLGRVVELKTAYEEGRIVTYVTLQVEQSFKGEKTERCTLYTPGGRWNGIGQKALGMAEFTLNERVLVFLEPRKTAKDQYRVLKGAMGKLSVSEDGLVTRDLSGISIIDEAGGLKPADLRTSWTLDEFARELTLSPERLNPLEQR